MKIYANAQSIYEIPKKTIDCALSYVHESEKRVRSVSVIGREYLALLTCSSPTYTKSPVSYISTSELAISSAQVGQVALESLVSDPAFIFAHILNTTRLSQLRESHQIYFIDWQVKFRKKMKRENYLMHLTNERIFTKNSSLFTQCNFRIGDAARGRFTALVPGEGGHE